MKLKNVPEGTLVKIYNPSAMWVAHDTRDVELFDDSIKEKENFIFKMFPILSAKYPNLSDDEILVKAKELTAKMYNKS